ncbi:MULTISPECIES: hypothetical protein [Burkholderia]|nr:MULTISPECIES: hypothetical protein [Burkholderia]
MSLLHVPTLGGRIFSVLCGSNLQFMDDAPTIYRSSDWAKHGFFRKCGMHLFYHLLPANEYGLSVGIFQDDPFPLATESQRMEHRGQAPEAGRAWRVHAVQRGDSRPPISVLLLTAAWSIGGTRTGVYFLLCALWRKALLKIVNYMEHYGIVRDPGTPVQPRHSRNTNRRISS